MNSSSTSPKPFCFVLMPFAEDFTDVYEFGIKGACAEVGVYCERVDEQVFLGSMLDRIYNQISRADLLVADMTSRNANVFYEVGYAHALGKPVVLLTQRTEDIPFDLKHFPHIVYGAKIKELRTQLIRRIEHIKGSPHPSNVTPLSLEFFLQSDPLSLGTVIERYRRGANSYTTLSLFNGTQITFAPGDFRIAVIAPSPYALSRDSGTSITALPNGTFLHMLPEAETLFPGAYVTVRFMLRAIANIHAPPDFDLTLRVFSSSGFRDFTLRFEQTDA